MPNKVTPGSITEPYKKGEGDFAPKLVGQQFVDGVTLFTLGNFAITTNGSPVQSNVYNTGSFSESYSLSSLNLTNSDSEALSNENVKVILNLDPSRLERYVYFGSFYDFIKSNIEQILLKWKGSLYIENLIDDDPERIYRNTILNYQYDSTTETSTFKVPASLIKNKFALIYTSEVLFNTSNEYGDISDLNNNYDSYQITNLFGDFYLLGFTGTTPTDNYIYLQVNGNPWPNLVSSGFGSFNYHIRPQEEVVNKYFFSRLNEFENLMLNRLVTPPYTVSVNLPIRNESGALFSSEKKLTWPTTDGYNIDNGSTEFSNYLTQWIDIALQMDSNKTDLVARRFVTESIVEFDTQGDGTEIYGRKVNKLLRLYGREFDEIKQYIDGITFSRIVTYSKKDNTSDELVKVLASELGLDVLLSYFEDNLFGNILPENSGEEGYGDTFNTPFSGYSRNLSPKELDYELWRRLVINAWWLFKSKGHRKVIEFFLNLFKIQSCVVSLDEYLYIAKNRINGPEALAVIADYLEVPLDELLAETGLGFNNGGYPFDNYGFPLVYSDTPNRYYQMYGFWYNGGNLSDLGNNPHIGPYDYGKNYFDRFRCFIDGFSGLVTGTTTFTKLDNIFVDYNSGDIEDGVPTYGDNYAEVLNTNNQISSNAVVLMAGSSNDITYDGSKSSLRITFNYGGSNCELTCPADLIYYDNGVIFANDLTTLNLNETNITFYFNNKQDELITATKISEDCCEKSGGYYLPISASLPTGDCPSQGQIMVLSTGLVLGVENSACCKKSVVGSDVYWDGSKCLLDNTNLNAVSDIFTIGELYGNSQTDNFVCYWCPPTKVLCNSDYYGIFDAGPIEPVGPSITSKIKAPPLPTGPVTDIFVDPCIDDINILGGPLDFEGPVEPVDTTTPTDFCVILSISNKNITNEICCLSKNGTLSKDSFGNTVCISNNITVSTTNATSTSCPTTFTFSETLSDGPNGFEILTKEILDGDGNPLSNKCCNVYSIKNGDPDIIYDSNLKKCLKKSKVTYSSCRHTLIETFYSKIFPQYHIAGDSGINGLNERVYLTITKMVINNFDHLLGQSALPSTVLDSNYLPPNKWNSVLFIQKTLNSLGIITNKAQLPGQPLNISSTPNTIGTITNIFTSGYGFYIIGLYDYQYRIEIETYTESEPNKKQTFYYSNTGNGLVVNGVDKPNKAIKIDCEYQIKQILNLSGENCFTIGKDITNGLLVEPTQCYPYTIEGNTYS